MEKGALRKHYELFLLGIILFVVLISFVIANNNVQVVALDGTNTFTVKEDQSFKFNITINNSHIFNITILNITTNVSGAFAFLTGSNGTSASANIQAGNINISFTNTSTVLEWINTSAIIEGYSANETFWFNATPADSGVYTFVVLTANSSGVVNTTSFTVTVNEAHNIMTTTGTRNFTVINEDTSSLFNITLNSTVPVTLGNITNITINFPSGLVFTANSNNTWLYNTSYSTFTNTSTSITWVNSTAGGLLTNAKNGSIWFNLTATNPGTYNFTVTTVNSQDAGIHQQNFTVSVRDITNPETPIYNCSKTRFTEGESPGSCSCTAIDNYDTSPTISYGTPTTTNAGTYTLTCTATDDATYNSSVSLTYTVDASGGDIVSSGGGTTYTHTYAKDTKEFSEIREVSEELGAKNRIRIKINNIKHEIGVKELTASTATIEIFSTPQTATINVGDTRKFDVTNDGYYDLSVTLNKIEASKADITLKSIYEEITLESEEKEKTKEKNATAVTEQPIGELPTEEPLSLTELWIGIIIVAVLLVIGIIFAKKKKKK